MPQFKVIELNGSGQVLSELYASNSKRDSQNEYAQANGTIVLVMLRGKVRKTLDSKGYSPGINVWLVDDTPEKIQ